MTNRVAAWVDDMCKTCGAYTHSCTCARPDSRFLDEICSTVQHDTSMWARGRKYPPKDADFVASIGMEAAMAEPKTAHSMSEYRRVTAQGGEVLPPQQVKTMDQKARRKDDVRTVEATPADAPGQERLLDEGLDA